MSNHVGVFLAAVGLLAAASVFGVGAGLAVSGLFLFVASVLLLIDFPTGKG